MLNTACFFHTRARCVCSCGFNGRKHTSGAIVGASKSLAVKKYPSPCKTYGIGYALTYIRIYLIGMPVIFLYNFEAAIFRSTGDTKIPLKALALSGVLNVILNLFFVICLKMTVNGVAIATVISNIFSSVILFVKLTKTDKWIHLDAKRLGINKKYLLKILGIGFPAGIQSAVFNLANVVIQSAINSLGTIVIAASSAAFNIEIADLSSCSS